jgi:hypothetical protein
MFKGLLIALTLAGAANVQAIDNKSGVKSPTTHGQSEPSGRTEPGASVTVENAINRVARALETANKKQETPDEKRRADQNIIDQNRLVTLGWFMLGAAVFELAFTLAGLVLLWNNLRAARDTMGEARRAGDGAKRQADAAVAALAQTKLATESELRAWVDVEAELVSFRSGPDHVSIGIKVLLANVGITPAMNVATSQEATPASSIVINRGRLSTVEKYPSAMPSLMPGKSAEQRFGLRIGEKETAECIVACRQSVGAPDCLMVIVDVIAYYRTIFDAPDAELRKTSVRYNIHPAKHIPPYDDRSREWIRNVNEIGHVKFAHDKSAPVYMT